MDEDSRPETDSRPDWSALMVRSQAGDQTAYLSLLKSVTPYLRALTRRSGAEEQETEDAVQDILLTIHTIRHTFAWDNLAQVAFGVAVLMTALATRTMIIRVQDRLIRLEMQGRLERVLPAETKARIAELRPGQLVALRFASDGELPALVTRVLAGELTKGDAIKRAITNWQADNLRA